MFLFENVFYKCGIEICFAFHERLQCELSNFFYRNKFVLSSCESTSCESSMLPDLEIFVCIFGSCTVFIYLMTMAPLKKKIN